MIRRPPRSTRSYTLVPYTTLFRSVMLRREHRQHRQHEGQAGIERAPNPAGIGAPLGRGIGRRFVSGQVHPPRMAPIRPNSSVGRSEEHTSELQSLMRISYAVFCLKNKTKLDRPIIKLKLIK